MGFPDWTLLGMGLTLLGALAALTLALLGQAPGLLKRLGLSGARLEYNVRAFTGYAFALLILAFGFFIAGVPLSSQPESTAASNDLIPTLPPEASLSVQSETSQPELSQTPVITATAATPATGAFGGPPSDGSEETEENPSQETPGPPLTSEITAAAADISEGDAPTNQASTPTLTPSPPASTPTAEPSPTRTPSPTITPTPILSETARINTAGSTIWIHRSPGGQNLVTVADGEIVILLSRHANQGGILWREVSTGSGVVGWVQEEFLAASDLP